MNATAKKKINVRVIEIKGERFIHADDIVRLILNMACSLSDPDARMTARKLADNIINGRVKGPWQQKQ